MLTIFFRGSRFKVCPLGHIFNKGLSACKSAGEDISSADGAYAG